MADTILETLRDHVKRSSKGCQSATAVLLRATNSCLTNGQHQYHVLPSAETIARIPQRQSKLDVRKRETEDIQHVGQGIATRVTTARTFGISSPARPQAELQGARGKEAVKPPKPQKSASRARGPKAATCIRESSCANPRSCGICGFVDLKRWKA